MPVNFQQIQTQIREKCSGARGQEESLRRLRDEARQLLDQCAGELEKLDARVQVAAAGNKNLRCAVPFREVLNSAILPPPISNQDVVLAADGSQINPSRHDRVEFGVINIGMIQMQPGTAPQEMVKTELLIYDDLDTPHGALTEEILALRRDMREREMLLEKAGQVQGTVVTLTDGPLELFSDTKTHPEFKTQLDLYLDVLERLCADNVTISGYVDKPSSDLVVRLLEIVRLPDEQLSQAGKVRPFYGLRDGDLFRSLLGPGERSAVFAIQSPTAESFRTRSRYLEPHFFYINVSQTDFPHIARVELPKWVSLQSESVNRLHAALLWQCRQMGARPYPYILHRAHEVAVVSFLEKQNLEDMILAELIRQGVVIGEPSFKQSAKDLEGRKRYGR